MKETSIHDLHAASDARMVEFGGWHMPVQYGPILEEVAQVRQSAGLFDLGHMGRFAITGPDAVALVDRVSTNHCAKIPTDSIRYSLLLNESGFPIDDFLIYKDSDQVYLVVNAANTEVDLAWMRDHIGDLDARVEDETEATAMLAVQGPQAAEVLQHVVDGADVAALKYYKSTFASVCGIANTRISRTGYTGELGFELYLPTAEGPRVWKELLAAGGDRIRPIGLGARDTLRLEAGMSLYGHEIDLDHDPLEAGLAFAVALTEEKGDFIGRAALEARAANPTRRLVGLTTDGKRVPRQGYGVAQGDELIGEVCSGSVSPTLNTNIATAYVRLGADAPGTALELDIRGKRQPCTVTELPFYSRTRKKKS